MLLHHIILLLLSWPVARAIEDEKPPPDAASDQMAMASEAHGVSFVDKDSINPEESKLVSTTSRTIDEESLRYENSNGFVPMRPMERLAPEVDGTTGVEAEKESLDVVPRGSGAIEDDPAYSTEARMFLNLGGPSADRRSFDTQDGQSGFEILKVTKETPAIANYHEFYENVQNNLNRNRADAELRYDEAKETQEGRTSAQNKRTKDRIKKIEKYLTNYRSSQNHDARNPYEQYYDNYDSGKSALTNQQKEIFEPERVQYHQETVSSASGIYNEAPVRQRTSSPVRSSYDDFAARQKYPTVAPKIRNSKPVVVIDMKYRNQQAPGKASDHRRSQKHRKESPEIESASQYDEETSVNREDRYGQSYERSEDIDDYPEEDNEYSEVTEKPRRIHKSKRRPYGTENARRLPKEHRGHAGDTQEPEESRKNNSPTRSKPHRAKAKPSYWYEDDRSTDSEENSDEDSRSGPNSATLKPSEKNSKQGGRSKGVANWSQVAPNIEVSHSNGYQISQVDKPKLLVPLNLNLLPLSNFDHSSALGNSQGFDFTNVPNFITATPIVSSQSPAVSSSQAAVTTGQTNGGTSPKNIQNLLNNNYGLSTVVPDIIVGQNTYQNPVQTVIMPQINLDNKPPSNLRPHYLPSTAAPMFAYTPNHNPNLHNIGPTMTSVSLQNFQTTTSPRAVNANQSGQHLSVNPTVSPAVPQLLWPQPTLQSFPLLHAPYNPNPHYNILVNPHGLQGQNSIQHGNANVQSGAQNQPSSTTTAQPLTVSSNNYNSVETQTRKNGFSHNNGQFVTTASFSVGNDKQQGQSNAPNDGKLYLPAGNQNLVNNINNNNANYYDANQNNDQGRSQQQQGNFYHVYRDEQNPNGKIKTYVQTAQVVPAIIHHANGIPVQFNNQNYANIGGHLQEQQSILSPTYAAHRPRDQNQQILKAANDIFENTWKQLQQLQSNDDAARRLPYQNVYRINDNIGSTSNANGNTINALPGANSAKAHLPILGTQNVEIVNPNIKPSPVDFSLINPYETLSHYPAAVLTTPIPIFSTTANFLVPRPAFASTTPAPINLQNYVDQLTQIGAQSNRVNKVESRPPATSQDHQRPVFNPINFVPNIDLIKSQSMLNNKHAEPLPNQLNLVPVIPGGNFFKNSQGAQTELVQKPRLSSDLEKYAEEMLKESLKTIYSTHKWNNDRKLRGNYSLAELNDLAKLRSELQRFKASMPDSKYPSKDVLEGHHSETKIRTAEPANRPAKKPELSIAEIEQLFKSDFKLNLPVSSESSHHGHHHHHKNRPSASSRPGSSSEHSTDHRNTMMKLSDYLTPPKLNSFVSKSPFIDPPKPGKKRPASNPSRYNSANGNSRPLPRPSSLVSRPSSSSPDASASNHVESGVKADSHHRHEKYTSRTPHYPRDHSNNYDYRSYPTFTTTSSPDNDLFKPSSSEIFSKNDYYDINHPRMHNLLGLLMKNKQLPKGSPQSFFRDEDDLRQYFDNERRRIHTEFYDENSMKIQKKSDTPVNMEPPPPSNSSPVRYHGTRGTL